MGGGGKYRDNYQRFYLFGPILFIVLCLEMESGRIRISKNNADPALWPDPDPPH